MGLPSTAARRLHPLRLPTRPEVERDAAELTEAGLYLGFRNLGLDGVDGRGELTAGSNEGRETAAESEDLHRVATAGRDVEARNQAVATVEIGRTGAGRQGGRQPGRECAGTATSASTAAKTAVVVENRRDTVPPTAMGRKIACGDGAGGRIRRAPGRPRRGRLDRQGAGARRGGGAGALIEGGKEIVFVTNNSGRPAVDLRRAPSRPGRRRPAEEQVVTAGRVDGEAGGGASRAPAAGAFVIGAPGFKETVAAAGLELLDGEAARSADAVLVSGHRGFDYGELLTATLALQAGAALFGTSRDPTLPMPGGAWPGTGATLAAIETASGKRAETGGKPEPHLFEQARALIPEAAGWRWSATGSPPTSRAADGRAWRRSWSSAAPPLARRRRRRSRRPTT